MHSLYFLDTVYVRGRHDQIKLPKDATHTNVTTENSTHLGSLTHNRKSERCGYSIYVHEAGMTHRFVREL